MQKYTFNAIWLVFEKVIRVLATAFISFYIARYLGPGDFGQLSYALAWLAILGAVSALGIDSIALREIARYPNRVDAILSTAILLKLAAGLFLVITACVAYLLSNRDVEIELILIVSFALIFQPLNLCEAFFQVRAESRKIIKLQLIQSLLSLLLKILIIYSGGSLKLLLWSYVFDALFLGIGIYRMYQKEIDVKISFRKFDRALGKGLLITAFPILLSGIAVAIYMKIDLIMLEAMVSPVQLGIYSAAAKLSESWYFIPFALYSAYSPLIYKLKKENQVQFTQRIKELYSLMIWGSIIIGLITSIFSGTIIEIIYGYQFMEASQVLVLHIWAGVFVCIGLVNSISLLANDRLYQNVLRSIMGALLNIGLNFLLIPLWGTIGAACATLVAYAFSGWISILFFKNGFQEFILPIRSLGTMPKLFS